MLPDVKNLKKWRIILCAVHTHDRGGIPIKVHFYSANAVHDVPLKPLILWMRGGDWHEFTCFL